MLQTKADVSKDILENITLGRFIRENRVEKNQDGMKWHAFKVGKFFMKHPVSTLYAHLSYGLGFDFENES